MEVAHCSGRTNCARCHAWVSEVEAGNACDWLEEILRQQYVISKLDKRTVDFVRQHDPEQAKFRLLQIFKYKDGIRDFNGYTRRAFEKVGMKRPAASVEQSPKRQRPGPTPVVLPLVQPSQAASAASVCGVERNILPSGTTSAEAKRKFYTEFVCRVEAKHHCRHTAPDMHQELTEPTNAELSRTIYSADMHVTQRGREIIPKIPRVNAHMKRCFRRFGSDRFLFVNIPNESFTEDHLEPFALCSRRYAFLFPKRTLGSLRDMGTRDERRMSSGYVVAVFFAETGPDIVTTLASRVREWHLPLNLACDQRMSIPKYAERFKLAMSDTDQTIELRPEMIEVRDDFRGCKGLPNTDGNGLISADLMAKIAERLGHPGRRISSVQVRLGSAKGLLVCSDDLREKVILFKEQVKYGDQSYYASCEPCQREVEVVSNGIVFADEHRRHPARLNSQLILVLQALGCPAEVFLALESRFRETIASIMINTETVIKSDFLPNADVSHDHGCSDLCFQIHAMHAAGLDHRTDNYLFECLRRYIIKQIQRAREDGHVPCPDTYALRMVSDFSRRLRPGTMSAYVPGRGFLLGPHLVTRIPCAHPGDIILLEAVDDFYESPGFAHENHAVMCADDSLVCSPASRMSGGDYDGDTAFLIGFRPIVDNVQVIERDVQLSQPDPLMGQYRAVAVDEVVKNSDNREQAVERALKQACVRMIHDAALVAKFNIMWTCNADRDISLHGHFQKPTELVVQYQELALDSAKTGWSMDSASLQDFQQKFNAPRPHWFRPGSSPARDYSIHSKSALGQLHNLQSLEAWIEEKLSDFKPPVGHGDSLMKVANSQVHSLLPWEKDYYEGLWNAVVIQFSHEKDTIRHASPSVMTYKQAIVNAQVHWHAKVDEAGRSRDAFALAAYKQDRGGPRVWELCFSELCRVHASQVAGREVVSVARGMGIGLHPVDTTQRPCILGPLSVPAERTQHAVVLKNLQRLALMRGPPDGGDLAHVPRNSAFPLQVDWIRWTHKDPSDHFANGSPIEDLVDDLEAGRVHPSKAPFLVLDIVDFDGCYWSLRNRRLTALKKYQNRLRNKGSTETLFAMVHLLPLTHPSVLLKFLEGFSTETWGESIELRKSSKTGR